jgi:hypothetical protein
MPLESDLFTKPKPNSRLEACLVDDTAHVTLRAPREKGDHVSRIQAALFIVMPDVNLQDELGSAEYGPLTADAVFRFKDTRTPKILNQALHQTVPDNIVGKLTIKELDKELLKRQGKTVTPSVTIRGVPLSGFSDFRLKRNGGEFARDPGQPLCQMVPVGGFRNLFVTTASPSDRVALQLPATTPHTRAFVAPGVVTVRGLTVGEDSSDLTVNGVHAEFIRLIVRADATITVHVHALVDTKTGKGAVGFDARVGGLIQGISRIYGGQANIRFQRGQFTTMDSVNGRKLDFDKPLFIDPRSRKPAAPDPSRQLFTLGDFVPKAINPLKEINLFITPNLIDAALPGAAGTSSIVFPEKMCWVKASTMLDAQLAPRLAGHEIGHVLGLTHTDTVRGTLMFRALSGGGDVIPAETLEQISIP